MQEINDFNCGFEDWNKIKKNVFRNIRKYNGDLLYKYRALDLNRSWITAKDYKISDNLERVIDMLITKKIYVPTLKKVNDPFEGRYIEYDVPGWAGKTMHTMAKREILVNPFPIKERYVLSLSSSPLVEQLWAYYCNNYEGVCIVIKNGPIFNNAKCVKYYKERRNVGMIKGDEFDAFIRELNRVNIYYKKREWNHEKEIRIEYNKNELDKNFIKCNDLIVALIIGHNTQQVVKERLIEVCHANNIETYCTYLNENDLDIMIVPTDFKYVYDGSPIEKQLENYYQKNNSILNYEGKLIEPVDINND